VVVVVVLVVLPFECPFARPFVVVLVLCPAFVLAIAARFSASDYGTDPENFA
jgi:hypothetical protein